jgi:hypothetical protein
MKKKLFALVLVLMIGISLVAIPVSAKPKGTVSVQLLAVNDFHGNREPPSSSSGCVGQVATLLRLKPARST